MRHLEKSRCGYFDYSCQGIGLMPTLLLVSDSKLYETLNSDSYITNSSLWPVYYNNIDNIPRFMAGPSRILELRYTFLGSCSYNALCAASFNIDNESVHLFYMYSDSFYAVQQQGGASYKPWASKLISYYSSVWTLSDSVQDKYICRPSILTPLYLTGLFNPIPAITVPVTIVATSGGGSSTASLTIAKSIANGTALGGCLSCNLDAYFDIRGYSLSSTKTLLKHPSGTTSYVNIYTNIGPCSGRVGSDSFSISRSWSDNDSILIRQWLQKFDYLTAIVLIAARITYANNRWHGSFKRYLSAGSKPDIDTQHDYLVPVASVVVARKSSENGDIYHTLKVTQLQCLPILIRDWVALTPVPSASPGDADTKYVYTRTANSDRMLWFKLVLCT